MSALCYTDNMTQLPIFITGNQSKADYLSRQLGVTIDHQQIDLLELQSTDLHKIVAHKLEQAYEICQRPVLVEDVSLVFNALGDLPGPYIKWFVEHAGDVACCKMLDGFADRTAVIRCTFGYYDGKKMEFFDSELPGTISDKPRGENGFGFDRFFINEGYSITRAEMSQKENERTYAELVKPFAKVRDFVKTLE
jgi:inosine triphosphate pyrophosphatase